MTQTGRIRGAVGLGLVEFSQPCRPPVLSYLFSHVLGNHDEIILVDLNIGKQGMEGRY